MRDTDTTAKGAIAAKQRSIDVVLAHGTAIELLGLRHLCEQEADFNLLASCSNDRDMREALARCGKAVLVLDLHLPWRGGLAALRELPRHELPPPVILVTSGMTQVAMTEAVRLGVKGVVAKDRAAQLLVQCIRQVHAGAVWIGDGSLSETVEQMIRYKPMLLEGDRKLTRRETEIARLVAEGLRNKDITKRLDIAEGTVKIHLHNIYEKLGSNDRVQLALRVRGEGLF